MLFDVYGFYIKNEEIWGKKKYVKSVKIKLDKVLC